MTTEKVIPPRMLKEIFQEAPWPRAIYCAGFELQKWRCDAFADHIIEWMADYALKEEELDVTHANMYVRLKEAAVRVYKTQSHEKRGEIGEIALHAICRDFFNTISIAPRVFYKTSSNDVVKSFDLVHARGIGESGVELWLGESKIYKSSSGAIADAIDSVSKHVDAAFLKSEKLILGPQISQSVPFAGKLKKLFAQETSLDELFAASVFPILIAGDSDAVAAHASQSPEYLAAVTTELNSLRAKLEESGLPNKIKLHLVYLPIGSKDELTAAFDKRLKGLMP